ncbi:MAG: hypothetical protein WC637_10825, partial [Victivallales bacterium]
MSASNQCMYAACAAVVLSFSTCIPLLAADAAVPLRQGMVSVNDRQVPPVQIKLPDVPHPFGKAPAPGVHPRVLFSPEDLPRIRKELKETACGRRAYASITGWASNATGGDKKPLGKVYSALVAGDLKALDYAESEWWKANISVVLGFESFICMIEQNPERTKNCCAALTTLAKILNGRTVGFGPAKSNPDINFGLSYDFLYNNLSEEQRATVRGAISASIKGKTSSGMELKPEQRTYNFLSHGMGLVVTALCIEGEEGYDPGIYPKSVEVLRDLHTYGVYPQGAPREGMHYYNFGMGSGGAMAMVAFARRGDNIIGHPHYQAARNWYLHDMEPFGYAFSMHCDTSTDYGGLLDNYILRKKVWPDDPVGDFVWRNRVKDDYSGISYRGDFIFAAIFPSDWKGSPASERTPVIDQWGADAANKPEVKPVAPWDPASLKQPLSFFDPDRGLLMTRSEWDKNALALHFECKMDDDGPSHSHANRNDISLSALGRKLVIDRGFGIAESKHHNMVLVDGRGQGFFCGSGKMVSYLDTPALTFVCGDAKDGYQWRYQFSNRKNNPESKGFDWQDIPGKESVMRAVDNPVRKAFRSVLLMRGAHPYVLILDDIQKDEQVRLYEWLLQTPDDLQALSIKGNDMILGVPEIGATDKAAKKTAAEDKSAKIATEAAPRLLVRVLDVAAKDNRTNDAGDLIKYETFSVRRSANTGSDKDAGLGKRAVVSSFSASPDYKILLFPYRDGQPLPTSVWSPDRKTLTITDKDVKDVFTFAQGEDGLTAYTLLRNDGQIFASFALKKGAAGKFSAQFSGAAGDLSYEDGKLYVS